jgi:hypothetical protein
MCGLELRIAGSNQQAGQRAAVFSAEGKSIEFEKD